MTGVSDAARRIAAALHPVSSESIDIAHLAGRVLAEDAAAKINQPPFSIATATGYAVRRIDGGRTRNLIGVVPAGKPFPGRLVEDDAVKIFSGAVVPEGADAIVLSENARAESEKVSFAPEAMSAAFIRAAGSDFSAGDILASTGKMITARDCALLAAGDLTRFQVRRRPRVAIASIGGELSRPGAAKKPGRITASTGYGLSAMIQNWGGAPCDFGILADTEDEIVTVADADADLIVTLGGVSVGDRGQVEKALGSGDFEIDFWNVAVQPARPLIFGRLRKTPLIGLPGHPVTAMIYAYLFLKPAVAALLGAEDKNGRLPVRFAAPLPQTGGAESYLFAALEKRGGEYWAAPLPVQDMAMLAAFATAEVLIVRPPNAEASPEGGRGEAILLGGM